MALVAVEKARVVVGTATGAATAVAVAATGLRPQDLGSEGQWSAVAVGEEVACIAAQVSPAEPRVR